MAVLFYPVYLFVFYFFDLPKMLVGKYRQINTYLYNLFSIPLLLRTYFEPLKNEYHEGLVLFSRFAGVFIKTALLLTSLSVLITVLVIELIVFIATLTLPLWLFYFLFLT